VIDAATAAELAILVQIRRRLQILDTAERDALLYGYNGIMELDGLWRRLGGPTPWGKRERVMDRLAGPRNRASHEGKSPSPEIAQRAIDLATEVVESVIPLANLTAL
jgi:hypothetical protein